MSELLIGMMVIYAVSIACFVEFYKLQLRDGKAKAWESILITVVMSAVGGVYIAHAYAEGMEIILGIILFSVQYIIDMEVVKRVFKAFMRKVIDE